MFQYTVYSSSTATLVYKVLRTHVPLVHPVPRGAPGIVSFTADENQPILTLSWTPPAQSSLNGPLSGINYRVRYGVVGEGATEVRANSSRMDGSGVQQYILSGLEYGTTYFAQVAAASSNGTGPYSTTITQTTVTISKQCGMNTYLQYI